MPCSITWDLAADLFSIFVLISFWAPLNGGGGRGQWWWVHFAVAMVVFQLSDGRNPWQFEGTCQRTYPIFRLIGQVISAIMLSADNQRLLAPANDVCRSGLCCVRTGTRDFFPWSATMPIPQLWEPYLPWNVVLSIAGLTLVLVLLGLALLCCCCQTVWICGRRMKPISAAPWPSTNLHTQSSMNPTLSSVLGAISSGREQLERHFGAHFSEVSRAHRAVESPGRRVEEALRRRERREETRGEGRRGVSSR